jgi:hypothetical protein
LLSTTNAKNDEKQNAINWAEITGPFDHVLGFPYRARADGGCEQFHGLETDHTGGFLGAGVSFADFNGDRIDDLSFAHHQGSLRFFAGTGMRWIRWRWIWICQITQLRPR